MNRLTHIGCLPLLLVIECWLLLVFAGCCAYAVFRAIAQKVKSWIG